MSHSLYRIRNLVAEIDQIQKQGQFSGQPHANLDSTPNGASAPEIIPEQIQATSEATRESLDRVQSHAEVREQARVQVQFSGGVEVELKVSDSGESVYLSRGAGSIEIRFSDGKAIHIPFKDVA